MLMAQCPPDKEPLEQNYDGHELIRAFLVFFSLQLAVSDASLLVVGRHLEPFWGSRESKNQNKIFKNTFSKDIFLAI